MPAGPYGSSLFNVGKIDGGSVAPLTSFMKCCVHHAGFESVALRSLLLQTVSGRSMEQTDAGRLAEKDDPCSWTQVEQAVSDDVKASRSSMLHQMA